MHRKIDRSRRSCDPALYDHQEGAQRPTRVTFSHHIGADFAASELARMLAATPSLCYAAGSVPSVVSSNATYEPSSSGWPKADGVVSILEPGGQVRRDIAIEYKRHQEGIHGLLTAMGQAHGYVHKGYSGALIAVPSNYSTHSSPAEYVAEVLDRISGSKAIGVFKYDEPDTTSPLPFSGRLHCVRPCELITTPSTALNARSGPKTQWVHMREGSTTRDAFLRFLQVAGQLVAGASVPTPKIPPDLLAAISRIAPGKDPAAYLANVADDRFLSQVWQTFWLEWVVTPDVLTPFVKSGGTYSSPNAYTRIEKDDGSGKSQIFEGRATGLKEKLVAQLNAGTISEATAWELFAAGIKTGPNTQNTQGIRDRAHSYREDLDSSLSQLQWIDSAGFPTDYGYRYMSICERYGGANSHAAIEYLGATLLQNGRYASFLHYVHRLSERRFSTDPLSFTRLSGGMPVFNEESYVEYLAYLEDLFVNELQVMRKVSGRQRPRVRTVFQAELTLLRNYGFVSKARHRLGVGIPIDWERVNQALNLEL